MIVGISYSTISAAGGAPDGACSLKAQPRSWSSVTRLHNLEEFAPPIRQAGSAAMTRVRVAGSPGLTARLAETRLQ
jgi:hypothetical protein